MDLQKIGLAALAVLGLNACGGNNATSPEQDSGNKHNVLQLGEGMTSQVVFTSGKDQVTTHSGQTAPAKENCDFLAFLPVDNSNNHGLLYINHETRSADAVLGDGGGGSVVEIKQENGEWQIANAKAVDFVGVGGTLRNCGGVATPDGRILTAEEAEPANNLALTTAGYEITDTSLANGLPKYQNMGWMVEVDPQTARATRKLYRMGRFMHEDAHIMPDNKTIYLTDDNNPAVFFKFECTEPGVYQEGQLYAYQMNLLGNSGTWLELPMDIESLKNIRHVAMGMGATLFQRHEWIDMADGKLYIAETGHDSFNWNPYTRMGAKPANYFNDMKTDSTYSDPFGRILVFDPATNAMSVYLEGGPGDNGKHFSNPDGLSTARIGEKDYLVISEDLIGLSNGRVPEAAAAKQEVYNDLFFLDLSIANPTVDDLKLLFTGPKGCETTGSCFTPDGQTMFVSIQHPDPSNPEPFNATCVVAVSGFGRDF